MAQGASSSSEPGATLASKGAAATDLILERCTQQQAFETFYTWSLQEHWNPSTKGNDIKDLYYKADPEGFFFGRIPVASPNHRLHHLHAHQDKNQESEEDEIVSIVSAVRYGDEQAWVGFYIVSPHHRGHGYGLQTFQQALKHAGHHRPSVGLDAVMAQVENYKKSGFTQIGWQDERRHGSVKELLEHHEHGLAKQIAHNEIPGLVLLSDPQVDLDQLPGIEERFSGLKRSEFVKNWAKFHAEHSEQHCFGVAVLSTDGAKDAKSGKAIVLGYGCVRPAVNSYRVGPLYATTPEIAKQLLVKLAVEVELADKQQMLHHVPLQFDVDVPNSNEEAIKIFNAWGWNDTFPSLRMWKGKVPAHNVNGIFGVCTLELG
ncbi:hypothetical protein EDD11_009405 [Mortierella claussenii]|nr:hypothetical protein EDD11_009405 [Mortierella claussenii]